MSYTEVQKRGSDKWSIAARARALYASPRCVVQWEPVLVAIHATYLRRGRLPSSPGPSTGWQPPNLRSLPDSPCCCLPTDYKQSRIRPLDPWIEGAQDHSNNIYHFPQRGNIQKADLRNSNKNMASESLDQSTQAGALAPSPTETLSPLEQEVLDEYARLLGNLNNVCPPSLPPSLSPFHSLQLLRPSPE
jgi:hypothetical protein